MMDEVAPGVLLGASISIVDVISGVVEPVGDTVKRAESVVVGVGEGVRIKSSDMLD